MVEAGDWTTTSRSSRRPVLYATRGILTFRPARRRAKPIAAKPTSIIAHVCGSGTDWTVARMIMSSKSRSGFDAWSS
jgi:hypothetical protein